MFKQCACLLLLLTAAAGPVVCAEENGKGAGGHTEAPKKKKERFPGYSKQDKDFAGLCEELQRDGHREFLVALLEETAHRDDACRSCYQLLKTFSKACRSKRRAKPKKHGEESPSPTPTPLPAATEPSAAAAASARKLFARIADDDRLRTASVPAVRRLASVLSSPEGKTAEQAAYLQRLSAVLSRPFDLWHDLDAYQKPFQKLCYYVKTDGHQKQLYKLLLQALEGDPECISAKALTAPFADECEPPPEEESEAQPAEEATVAIPTPVQAAAPSDDVEEALTEITGRLLHNEKLVDDVLCAIHHLARAIAALPAEAAPEERSYFTMVADDLREPFRYYAAAGDRRGELSQLCRSLERDGRRSELQSTLEAEVRVDKARPAMRPLVKAWVEACHEVPKNSHQTPPAAIPHLVVINSTVELFLALAQLKDMNEEFRLATDKIVEVLRRPEGKSKRTLLYYDVLIAYIQAPFPAARREDGAQQPAQAPRSLEDAERQGLNVDELFDF